MNRSLVIPATLCLIAFATLWAVLHGATGRETVVPRELEAAQLREHPGTAPTTPADSTSDLRRPNGKPPLSAAEAEQVLTTLADEYLSPWRQWESSPSRLFSRAAPRPIPTIFAKIDIPPSATDESDYLIAATIVISTGGKSQPVPCVIDRITKRVRLFADEQWLAENEWLKKAPLPHSTRF